MISLPVVDVSACAPAGITEPIAREEAEKLAALMKAVADPTRLQLLSLINAAENGEACTCHLTEPLQLSQPTVSHHLKILSDAGLVEREKRGTWVWFRVNQQRWSEIARLFL